MPEITVEQALQIALREHRAGRVVEAETIYLRVLAVRPRHPLALHLLGVLASETGRNEMALELLGKAVAILPEYAEAHADLGNVLQAAGRLDEAIAAQRRALQLKPDRLEAHNNLGNALLAKGEMEAAMAAYRQALEIAPDCAAVHANLGNVLRACGRLDEAIACFGEVVRLSPEEAGAHLDLGVLLLARGEADGAIRACQESLRLRPGHAESYVNLGNAFQAKGKYAEAAAAYGEALRGQPEQADVHNNLGAAFLGMGRLDAAAAAFGEALRLQPELAGAHNNLGNTLKDQGRMDAAIASYRRAVALQPNSPEKHSTLLFGLNYHEGYDGKDILAECMEWDRRHAQPLADRIRAHGNDPSPERRLRIGYVSPDFGKHVVACHVLPLMREHDRAGFEIYHYADHLAPGALTERLRGSSAGWRNISGLGDEQAAEMIRADRIDILVDLTMHMARNRLLVFARKPAPVQAAFVAYPGTTGLAAMDYRLTDPWLDPPGAGDGDYREESIRLEHSFWCYDLEAMMYGREEELPAGRLPVLDSGVVTFGFLGNFCKVNERVLRLWARVLKAVSGSRLLLLTPEGSHRLEVFALLGEQGIVPERVEMLSRRPHREYLELYRRIDIALDTTPYNGHTTSLDALWMGAPVVTLVGRTIVGRAGLSQLSNLGLTELVAQTPEEYVRIAAGLAGDLERLAALRNGLRERMRRSPLTDAVGFTRGVETAYRGMWRKWCASQR